MDHENPEGEQFLVKMHEKESPLIPVLIITEDDDLSLNNQLFCYGVIDIINKKYISDENFKRFFDVFIREDRLLKELRNMNIAVLDGNKQCLNCYKALLDFYGIKNTEYFSEPEELLFCNTCYDFYILDVSMPRVSGEDVVKISGKETGTVLSPQLLTEEITGFLIILLLQGRQFFNKTFYCKPLLCPA